MKIAYWNLIIPKSCLKYEWYILWLWLLKGSFVFRILSAVKNIIGQILILFIFMLKTLIMGTLKRVKRTHNLCFGSKIRNMCTPLHQDVTL